jgi:hypothetical protein
LTALRDVAEGARVRVVGRLELVEPALAAPITRRGCAAYRVELQALDEGRRVFVTDEQTQDFLVRDQHGELARVRARAAHLLFDHDAELRTGRAATLSPPVAAFLARHRQETRTALGRPLSYFVREGVLAPGQEIAIVGRARREIDRSGRHGSYRHPPTRLVFDAAGDEPLYVAPARR